MMGTLARFTIALLAVLGVLAAFAALALFVGALLDPTISLFAVVGSMVWATYGPFLLVATVAAALVGIAARMHGWRRLGGLATALSAAGGVGAAYILARIWLVAAAAGAEIRLVEAFELADMGTPAPDLVETVRVVEGTRLRAAIYVPPPATEPAPVIVYVHGGGFMTGTYTETAADLRWFADQGWLVFSLEYRLFGEDNPTWDKAPDDTACGLGWAYRNAARFRGDPARIALLGDSAGGNLAINVGYAAASGWATSTCGTKVPSPRAIAVMYPAVDPMSIYELGFPIPDFEPERLIEGYIGGRPEDHPNRVSAVASETYLTREAPPTLVILPEKDSLVVAEGTLGFVEEAKAQGVNLELVRIPFANHVFNQVAANSLGNQIGRTVRLRFLAQEVR